MKKIFILCAALITALASCTNDESVNNANQYEDGAISFNAFVPKMSRGTSTTTDGLKTSGFYVFAYNQATGGNYTAPFMDDVAFSYNTTNQVWDSSPVYYWPQKPLDFFAYYPNVMAKGSVKPQSFTYTVANDAKTQQDVVMTYAANQTQPGNNNPLELKFHHALSQINFVIKTKGNSNLNVKVNSVSMKNVFMKGDIAYNLAATAMPYFTISNASTSGNPINTPTTPITVDAGTDASVNPASTPISGMFLLPQTLTCWTYAATKSVDMTGTYININGALSGATQYEGNIAIPITTDKWMPGYSYTYTILFGEGGSTGGGGYNPDKPDPDDPNKPQQILVPIVINVTVDDWVNITPPIDVIL